MDYLADNLIPSAAKLLLQQNPKTRSDLLSQDRSDSGTETATFDFEDQDFPPENDYDYTPEDFRDSSYNDYGLSLTSSSIVILIQFANQSIYHSKQG
jgi:hypothetical protein